jgi:hypothetical protein
MITAEDIMIPYFLSDNEDKDLIKSALIEFAKIHVELALKKASENIKLLDDDWNTPDKQSILNAYPLTNIK